MQHFLLELIPIQGILNSIILTVSVCERLIVILIMHETALARICQYADLILCDEIDVEKELLDAIEESMKECIREQTELS